MAPAKLPASLLRVFHLNAVPADPAAADPGADGLDALLTRDPTPDCQTAHRPAGAVLRRANGAVTYVTCADHAAARSAARMEPAETAEPATRNLQDC